MSEHLQSHQLFQNQPQEVIDRTLDGVEKHIMTKLYRVYVHVQWKLLFKREQLTGFCVIEIRKCLFCSMIWGYSLSELEQNHHSINVEHSMKKEKYLSFISIKVIQHDWKREKYFLECFECNCTNLSKLSWKKFYCSALFCIWW